ncbi:putative phosphoenolpyruvate synthase like protein [Argiope bruennichi]|uniref:Putative phosphoenolpyruvate synthase like protein n=1 Tax=Argiope bruennichi TaxID=94029 RepID=A0A8T0FMN7_ARGBR|nr:putative phosphoenolpyruvate synthase like protein [Argiope bruennichi]
MLGPFLVTLFTAPLELIFWIKWAIAYLAIRFYNAFHSRRFELYDINSLGDPVKLGYIVPPLEKELESPFLESHVREAADEVVFYGVNSKSECALLRIARGSNQIADAWIYLKLANGKTYCLSESVGYQQSSEGICQTFSCGKLQMHYLSPMRRWRIFFCGMLKETSEDRKDHEETAFVKFTFLWKAASDVYDCTFDTNPEGFAKAMARSDWRVPFVPPIKKFTETINFYLQTGCLNGTVTVNDGSDYEMYLFGEKMRSLGKTSNIAGCKFVTVLGNTPENGMNFHLTNLILPQIVNNLPFGFLCDDSGNVENLKELDINIKPFDSENPQSPFSIHFTTGQNYEVIGNATEPIIFYSGQAWSGFLEMSFIEFTLRGKKGSGIILSGEVYKAPKQPTNPLPSVQFPQTVPFTVQFTDDASHFGEITGGKGSSLGKLTRLSEIEKSFTVPKGIVVTTAAYKEFVNQEILDGIKHLENIAYGKQVGDLKKACNKVSKLVEKAPLPNKICHSIMEDLKDIFGDEVTEHKFAVRSSATGEDTAAMSAAGQMDTFLGIQGFKEIFTAVKKCWASQFGHIAIEYKRRNGQILNSPMAVVIQDMVASEVSGVMFTCDPVTNNPSVITITANYGLGETVVSGSVEPDTFVIRRKESNKLEIEEVVVGAKHQRMVMQDSGGTATEDIDENSRNEACLSKETVIRLGRLGVKIEKYYKSSRDIEFGIANDKVFILQSRPVTNVAAETDYEIQHEFDNALRCENVYYTIANVGEVLPGATTPLTIDLVTKYFSVFFERQSLRKSGLVENFFKSKYFLIGVQPFSYHMMMTAAELLTRYGIDTPRTKGFMISVFGRIITDPGLLNYAYSRCKGEPEASLKNDLRYYWELFFYDSGYSKIRESIFNYPLDFLKYDTAKETYDAILRACSDFDGLLCKSMQINCRPFGFHLGIDTDFIAISQLLAKRSNVESANVPQAMQEVALQIVKDIGCEKFSSMTLEEAEEWLLTSPSAAGRQFRQFLQRHGHRCLKEFDVRSVTWGSDPKILIKLLQNLAPACKEQPKDNENSMGKIFSQLHIPLNFLNKYV